MNDRWQHSIQSLSGEFLASVEGLPDQSWPPSPPLQDPSRHELEQGDAVLAVGMAGKSHWSASFLAQDDELVAELACLLKGEDSPEFLGPEFLGSTYRVTSELECELSGDGTALIKTADGLIELSPMSGDGWSTKIVVSDSGLQFIPNETAGKTSQSIRWGYRMKAQTR